MSFLRETYETEAVPSLIEDFDFDNEMRVPEVEKVVVNMGLGEAVDNPKIIDNAVEELAAITAQEPVVTRAKRSIAGFKVRKGQPIGAKVTLRDTRMFEFLERLIYVALPRVRDFEGIDPEAFDGHGNYSLGIEEQIIFPEIEYDSVDKIRGLEVTVVTSAENDEQGRALLTYLDFPFSESGDD
ncbi:MAG: 50S ribosomal protein L5 [Bradymonadaceae bacterium]